MPTTVERCNQQLDEDLEKLVSAKSLQRLVVGYSGGLDSTVLLHLLFEYCKHRPQLRLEAVHINHQLSENALSWQKHCESVCERLSIPLLCRQVVVEVEGNGVESAARDARHQVFIDVCGDDGALLLAHHLDDQAETFFIRLMRGSGPLGLSSMKTFAYFQNMPVLRPLLLTPRAELEKMAADIEASWVMDESNESSMFDRNYLRNEVLPLLSARWPAMTRSVSRSARLCHEAVCLADEVAQGDAERMVSAGCIDVEQLGKLSPVRAKNLLRFSLRGKGISLPAERVLQRVLDEVLCAKRDSKPVVRWAGGEVRSYDGKLYLLKPLGQSFCSDPGTTYLLSHLENISEGGGLSHDVTGYLLPWGGELFVSTSRELLRGVRSQEGAELSLVLPIRLSESAWKNVGVGLGHAKLKIQPMGRSINPLKHWWQHYKVPYWFRQKQPLLYCENALVLAPGLGVCVDGVKNDAVGEERWIGWWPYSFASVVSVD